MIGDALEKDVLGATWAGIHVVWVVRDGIHRWELPPAELQESDGEQGKEEYNDTDRHQEPNNEEPLQLSQVLPILKSFHDSSARTYAKDESQMLQPNYIMGHFSW